MSINITCLLAAIAIIETGGDDHAIGPCGERGRYQITEAVWREETGQTAAHWRRYASRPEWSRYVAARRLRRIITVLGAEATPYRIACRWNAGVRSRYGSRTRDYAGRVAAVYDDALQRAGNRLPP
jgi:hypothetical protein